ncbi:beta-galactosidase [Xanthomonas graminis]|uniref:beta-galactosidase n=1 Tax=Xanthomonas graminis TaxID=3390026 RepID=UPI001F1CF2D0|nr:beta-galactosidase [Xanthomonas translucens]UKE73780.1 beta-galactosidase [Xanthomonas translucens pv. phleipratensis]
MKRRNFCLLSVLAPLGMAAAVPSGAAAARAAPVPDGRPHTFGFAHAQFVLDGQPWQIRSGEMHPLRIPREDWLQRIRMAKAMGLNTIALYLMWNALETQPGVFDLDSGRRDFAAFIRLCAQEGMWVYLRPGPYVCAEWTLGGLPAYLLREPGMRLRDAGDARYMAAVRRYIAAVAPRIAPLLVAAGGPVLMLQIENEYSMFGDDVGYLQSLRALWQEHGIDGPFAVADGMKDLRRRKAYLPGAALGLDGADLADLQHGRAFAGAAPVWVAEGYPGWLTHWGDADFARRDYLPTLRRLLAHGHSFNLYVVHGGSNFGLSAGANANDDGSNFQPALTSYDYAAPIDERGAATPAYFALRAAIAAHLPQRLPQPPAAPPRTTFAPTLALPYAALWDNLPAAPLATVAPAGNELLFGQDQGLVLYRRRIGPGAQLRVDGVHDYAVVHVDGEEVGHVSRVRHRALQSSPQLTLPRAQQAERALEILVDSFGHVNFGPALGDAKGLVGEVQLQGVPLQQWQAYPIALDDAWIQTLQPLRAPTSRPGLLFRAQIVVETRGDVYLDMREWDKGYLWVNGQLLGRYWRIGPQQCLYCPRSWLRQGRNEVLVLDLHRTRAAAIRCANALRASA